MMMNLRTRALRILSGCHVQTFSILDRKIFSKSTRLKNALTCSPCRASLPQLAISIQPFSSDKSSSKSLVPEIEDEELEEEDWLPAKDEQSGLIYFYNPRTQLATAPGDTLPDWVPVDDPDGSDQIYWWNTKTDETTAVGEACPLLASATSPPLSIMRQGNAGGGGLMGVMKEGMAFGVGSAIAHQAVGAVAGSLFGDGEE